MSQATEIPIMVSGLGRSGTTWMQWFLSQHPRIHIHGQSPNLFLSDFWDWYQTLLKCGQWSVEANRQLGYEIAHYAGSGADRTREIFKRMFRDYMTGHGPNKPRWGLKWIDMCAGSKEVGQFESLWPETRWIVCVRDPFATICSMKNTFVPNLNLRGYAERWVNACKFIESHDPDRMAAVQMDKLKEQGHEQRLAAMERVFACVGEEPSQETDAFLRAWPVVHKVKPDNERKFLLSGDERQQLLEEVSELGAYMREMGYRRELEEVSVSH